MRESIAIGAGGPHNVLVATIVPGNNESSGGLFLSTDDGKALKDPLGRRIIGVMRGCFQSHCLYCCLRRFQHCYFVNLPRPAWRFHGGLEKAQTAESPGTPSTQAAQQTISGLGKSRNPSNTPVTDGSSVDSSSDGGETFFLSERHRRREQRDCKFLSDRLRSRPTCDRSTLVVTDCFAVPTGV